MNPNKVNVSIKKRPLSGTIQFVCSATVGWTESAQFQRKSSSSILNDIAMTLWIYGLYVYEAYGSMDQIRIPI